MTTESKLLGFVASTLVLVTFALRDMRALRLTAILSNVAFIIYAATNWLVPILALHLLLLPINVCRLREVSRKSASIAERGVPNRATQMAIEALYVADAVRGGRYPT
jgi:hypothetical protein